MRIATVRSLLLTLVFALALATGACSKKTSTEEGMYDADQPVSSEDTSGNGDSDSGNAEGLQTVYYPFDSSTLDSQAQATLDSNASILKEKSNLKVQIEGHCDERGGIQYNIALGERRAKAAKAYMVDKGISSSRVSIISYGKEKPLDGGHDEGAWAKNRRSNFRITEK